MGPSRTKSLVGRCYILIVVDDYSRFTWIKLLRKKSEVYDLVRSLCKRLKNEKDSTKPNLGVITRETLKNLALRISAWKKNLARILHRSLLNKME